MNIQIKTIKDATRHWVDSFNAVSQHMFKRAYAEYGPEGARVVAAPYHECEDCGSTVSLLHAACEDCGSTELQLPNYLPMWGTLWSFGDASDERWADESLDEIAACGFLVYETDDDEIFIGIDGAGYDFYEAHWIPLYKARGLEWHEEEDENNE